MEINYGQFLHPVLVGFGSQAHSQDARGELSCSVDSSVSLVFTDRMDINYSHNMPVVDKPDGTEPIFQTPTYQIWEK